MSAVIELNRGSDLTVTGFWPSAPGSAQGMNLTGYTIDATEVHESLAGNLTLAITDAADGGFSIEINWHEDMPSGPVMSFIVRISLAGKSTTLPKITVLVK